MYLKFEVAVLFVFGLTWPSLSDENVLDLFPEFAELRQNFETVTGELNTNVQNLQTAVTSLQRQYGSIEKDLGADETTAEKLITFSPAFSSKPAVVWGIDKLDSYHQHNLRVKVEKVMHTKEQLQLKLSTWSDTRLYRAKLRWMACPRTI